MVSFSEALRLTYAGSPESFRRLILIDEPAYGAGDVERAGDQSRRPLIVLSVGLGGRRQWMMAGEVKRTQSNGSTARVE